MGLNHIADEINAMNRARAETQTWGHLAPKPRKKYSGWIMFCHGAYGDITPIQASFKNLPDSPWFFEDMNEFIGNYACPSRGRSRTQPGRVYVFNGTYMKFKNGKCRFTGNVRWRYVPRWHDGGK